MACCTVCNSKAFCHSASWDCQKTRNLISEDEVISEMTSGTFEASITDMNQRSFHLNK